MRWKTGDVPSWKEPFRNSAQAESFRSELVAAARKGEAFRLDDGRPVSWGRQATTTMSWYDFCVAQDADHHATREALHAATHETVQAAIRASVRAAVSAASTASHHDGGTASHHHAPRR